MKHVPREFRSPIEFIGSAKRVHGRWMFEDWMMGEPPPSHYSFAGIEAGPKGYEAMGGWPIEELVEIAKQADLIRERRSLYAELQDLSPRWSTPAMHGGTIQKQIQSLRRQTKWRRLVRRVKGVAS